jgi:hypothetical protein
VITDGSISRHLSFSNDILFIDGSWGTGKSILGPVLGAFKGVEKQKLDHIFEYVSTAYSLGEMSKGAASSLLKIYADLDTFDSQISREVNFRPSDDSGILNNPNGLKYLKRLFVAGDNEIVKNIEEENPVLQIMSHHILPVADILADTYGKRIKIVEMFRHPLFMLDHWLNYIDRCGTDVREFTIWIKHKEHHLPWFAKGWEEKFISLSGYDKVIHSIAHTQHLTFEAMKRLEKKIDIISISFEKFVLDPYPDLRQLTKFLGRSETKHMSKVLKRQKCPRESLMDGRGHKSYGFKKVEKNFDDKAYILDKLVELKSKISGESYDLLLTICQNYESHFNLNYIGS